MQGYCILDQPGRIKDRQQKDPAGQKTCRDNDASSGRDTPSLKYSADLIQKQSCPSHTVRKEHEKIGKYIFTFRFPGHMKQSAILNILEESLMGCS